MQTPHNTHSPGNEPLACHHHITPNVVFTRARVKKWTRRMGNFNKVLVTYTLAYTMLLSSITA